MGSLYYGSGGDPFAIPDRLLAHVKMIVATKLRRGESFTVSWQHTDDTPGRTTLWLQPAIPLRFVFESAEPEMLNPIVLRRMADLANSSAGLMVALDEVIPEREPAAAPAAAAASAGAPAADKRAAAPRRRVLTAA